ncbi:hypothetical protein EYC59_06525 [Candidatus Saccharibacteria bacterium]|nr:MAG: hypothetical protein EYC59_06525 [Candidatus Saccharibacteria bacterium]
MLRNPETSYPEPPAEAGAADTGLRVGYIMPNPADCQEKDDDVADLLDALSNVYVSGLVDIIRSQGRPVPRALTGKARETGPLFPMRRIYAPEMPHIPMPSSIVRVPKIILPQPQTNLSTIEIPSEI